MIIVKKKAQKSEEHKKYTLRFRAVDKDKFENLRRGIKRIETRAATSKYSVIKAGDSIIFRCADKSFSKNVSKARIFNSVEGMLRVYKIKDIMPHLDTVKKMKETYHSYPNYKEKMAKYGLIAIEFSK